ncbi:calcium-transporting P [Myriangium duriaei CBS 260.36]|uniref:P-type Ca(2+) transporter n=1 Tax=Myriangium duriaei CBS 260.36 TaxID=1168546 RepID=A0A9P4JFE0_9PEZI|nr:calcium-transporting P [Myriangium duriaei CBS 260.36]
MSRSSTPALPLHNEPVDFKESRGPGLEHSELDGQPKKPVRAALPQSVTPIFSSISAEDAAARLDSSLTSGLHPTTAQTRYYEHGPNELPHEEPEPLWLRFVKQFKETLILLLLGSAAISAFMGNYEDAVSITIAVTIVVTVAFVQEYRSEKSIEALNSLVPHGARVIRSTETREDAATPQPNGEVSGKSTPDNASRSQAAAQRASTSISASQLVPGDLVLFHTGDRIPADIRITHCADLTIDESNLTGENEPVHKQSGILDPNKRVPDASGPPSPIAPIYASPASGTVGADLRLNDQTNIAFMGTLVRSGYGRGIVVGTGGNTEFGAISASLQEIESPRTPLQQSMDRLGKELSYVSFGVIALIMVVGLLRGYEFLELFQIGVSLAVAAIPEGLPIIVTVTLALGVLRMSKRHAIVRRLPSVETLGSVNVICSDKTGTLTTNHMTVTKMWHFGNDEPVDTAKVHAASPVGQATRTILRIGNIVNNGRLSAGSSSHATASSAAILSSTAGRDGSDVKSRWTGQPTDVALLDLVDAFGEDDLREHLAERRNETPFSSERKWMGCVVPNSLEGHGSDIAYIKGALEQVLRRCDTYLDGNGSEVVLDEQRKQDAFKAAEAMGQDGLRVLGLASGPVQVRSTLQVPQRTGKGTPSPLAVSTQPSPENEKLYHGLCFAGLVGMNDPPRKGIERSIRRLMAGGVKVIMITGDAETTAVAIAKKLGMPINMSSALGSPVLRGEDLDRMSEEELAEAIVRTQIFARTSPEHKMKIVRALQSRGDVVAMTGDGVNDAPALKKADIGISMGKLGTDVAKEAADMILTDDDFSTILNAIEEGKGIFYNIQNFLTFQLSTSAAALGLVMLSSGLGLKNPLNAMQILWINILMDGPPAQSLGVEPVDKSLLSLPPRQRHARVLTKHLIRRVLQSSAIIMLGTLYMYWSNLTDEDMSSRTVSPRDTTLTFTAFVFFDMFNALTCRSVSKSVLDGSLPLIGRGSNKMFNYAVSASILGQLAVIYLPPLQAVFQTEALSGSDLLRLVALASLVFWVDEGRKWWHRRRYGAAGAIGKSTASLRRTQTSGYSTWV